MNNNTDALDTIKNLYPSALEVRNIDELPKKGYMVYILLCNGKAIVVGQGKKNRAKVMFDVATAHYKALLVRLYMIHEADAEYKRYIIPCDSKEQSKAIEYVLHHNENVGGAGMNFTEKILKAIECKESATANMLIKIALLSSYDGLSDIRKWHNENIISDSDWNILKEKFNL